MLSLKKTVNHLSTAWTAKIDYSVVQIPIILRSESTNKHLSNTQSSSEYHCDPTEHFRVHIPLLSFLLLLPFSPVFDPLFPRIADQNYPEYHLNIITTPPRTLPTLPDFTLQTICSPDRSHVTSPFGPHFHFHFSVGTSSSELYPGSSFRHIKARSSSCPRFPLLYLCTFLHFRSLPLSSDFIFSHISPSYHLIFFTYFALSSSSISPSRVLPIFTL
jgi:hypothetical protein